MRRENLIVLLNRSASALVALLLFGCPDPKPPPPSTPPPSKLKSITIVATGDVGSDTDVCGCKARQLGGVARRAQVVASKAGAGTLVLDAGDLFFRHWSISPRYEPQARATAEFHADALKMMGTAAMAVGERDLALGLPLLRTLGARAEVKLLSANLVHTKSSTLAFAPYALVPRDGVTVGLIGASPEIPPKAQAHLVYERNGVTTRPLEASIVDASKKAKAQGAEVIVALMHVGQDKATALLNRLPPGVVDLAIVAHDRRSGALALSPDGRSAWVHAGARGKWVLALELGVRPGAKGIMNASAIDAQQKAMDRIRARIADYERETPKDPVVAEERNKTKARLATRLKKMEAEMASISTAGKHVVSGELLPLDKALPEEPKMLARYRAYQEHLFEVNSGEPPPDRAELKYVGSEKCKACHLPAFKQWKKTKHAKAWATMVRTRQTSNLDCIPCHVTGFDRRGGPRSLMQVRNFINVGCESCHGPGSAHAANEKVAMDYGKQVPERVCAECHRAQEDQKPFVYEDRLPKILGRGHGK